MAKPTLDEIFGNSLSQRPSLDDIFGEQTQQRQPLQLTPEIAQRAAALRPKKNAWDNVAEYMVTSPQGRGVGMALQGASNSMLRGLARGAVKVGDAISPIGRIFPMSGLLDIDTKPLQAQNATERAIETGSQFAGDSAVMAAGGNALKGAGLLGKGMKLPSRIVQGLLTGNVGTAAFTGLGGGALTGAVNPESFGGQLLTSAFGGMGAGGVKSVTSKALNPLFINLGVRNLEKQLTNGASGIFKDVGFGRISPNKLKELNRLRGFDKFARIDNNKAFIPADRIQHLYEQRIVKDKYKPKEVVDVLKGAIHNKNNIITPSKYRQLQAFVDVEASPNNVAIVGKHRDNGGLFVKTGYKKDASEIAKGALDGRRSPSSLQSGVPEKAAGRRLSAFQGYTDNISDFKPSVKKNYLVEALNDYNKTKKLKSAVASGQEDIANKASFLADRMGRRADGAVDEALDAILLRPELKTAQNNYRNYMNENGMKTLPKEIMDDFYKRYPTAKDEVIDMRRKMPGIFKDIPENSVKELDELKRLLRKSTGNTTEKSSSQKAFGKAQNELKSILEQYVPGFKQINQQFADASYTQDIFNKRVLQNAQQISKLNKKEFWSPFFSTLSSAGLVGGFLGNSPTTYGALAAGLGGRALHRAIQRAQGRALMDGTTLSAEILRNTLNGGNSIFQNIKYPVGAEYFNNYRLLKNNPLNAY